MNKPDFHAWLAQRQTRLVELICEETVKATQRTGKIEVELFPRVQRWVNHFVQYVETGNFQIMIDQIETANRQKLARGEKLNFESAERQAGYILRAFERLTEECEGLTNTDRDWLNVQVRRSMKILNTNARIVYSRLMLEQAQNALDNP